MQTHGSIPDDPGDDRNAVVVPLPRKALDDDTENLPQISCDQPVWRYNQTRKRGDNRSYSGYINRVHGAEAKRLRGQLAGVIRDLLDWAAKQSDDQSTEDGEAA